MSLYADEGELFNEYSALLVTRGKIEMGKLLTGKVKPAFETRARMELGAQLCSTVPFSARAFLPGMDTSSPAADAYFEKAPFL